MRKKLGVGIVALLCGIEMRATCPATRTGRRDDAQEGSVPALAELAEPRDRDALCADAAFWAFGPPSRAVYPDMLTARKARHERPPPLRCSRQRHCRSTSLGHP